LGQTPATVLNLTRYSIGLSCYDIASVAMDKELQLGMTKRKKATEELSGLPVGERAQLVRDIALRSHKEAINLNACRALIETIPRNFFKDAQVARAALQVDRSLVERVLIISESALGVVKFPNDRHAHLAMSLLNDAAVFEEVARSGNAQGLRNAQNIWMAALSDWRRDLLKHYRDKFVAHRAEPNPDNPIPELDHLIAISGRVVFMLAQLATGAGYPIDQKELDSYSHYLNAQAFWRPWLPRHLR
jgi:hypothetical protein